MCRSATVCLKVFATLPTLIFSKVMLKHIYLMLHSLSSTGQSVSTIRSFVIYGTLKKFTCLLTCLLTYLLTHVDFINGNCCGAAPRLAIITRGRYVSERLLKAAMRPCSPVIRSQLHTYAVLSAVKMTCLRLYEGCKSQKQRRLRPYDRVYGDYM